MNIYLLSDTIVSVAKNLPVISIAFLDTDLSFDKYDALILTSKNSLKALEHNFQKWKEYPVFAIGKATADCVTSFGGNVVFYSDEAYGESLADEITKNYSSMRFLYPRAKVVAFDLATVLKERGVSIDEKIVYETSCNQSDLKPPEDGSTIIFSSPSTVECFFKKFSWQKSYKAIVIGKTTASHMPTYIDYIISPQQNLHSAVEFAISNMA